MVILAVRSQHDSMRLVFSLCCLLPLLGACADSRNPQSGNQGQAEAATEQSPSLSGKKVYELMCSMCHGETGDGKGIVVLKTKARSFVDGGFSFGNTPDAVYRTISNGIGGTEMPPFQESLSEAERRAVTEYVLAFNPENSQERAGDPVMRVTGKPLIVRGHLPSVSDKAPERPRGILIGTADGLSWEYRADDVRLLAMRRGGFVERSDWGGRGGTPLKPLGEVLWLNQGGDPAPPWRLLTEEGEETLTAKLSGTTIREGRALVLIRLEGADKERVGTAELWCSSSMEGGELKPVRHFQFVGSREAVAIQYEDLKINFVPGLPKEFSK
ncbi:MAG: c-type cytochrome [Planctomycetota bacterium]|jgi:mono/diheme cytochrome c family protein|nr:c-type cytochrome [Planctomycetota bacterium]|tara:strand:- start:3180 stop:4163 length:984 start_codon:yes stop_codon:yes gene_type:complete